MSDRWPPPQDRKSVTPSPCSPCSPSPEPAPQTAAAIDAADRDAIPVTLLFQPVVAEASPEPAPLSAEARAAMIAAIPELERPPPPAAVEPTIGWFDATFTLEERKELLDIVKTKDTFDEWCAGVGLNSSDPDVLALGLWGDGAVISAKESLFVLLLNCLSGICNRRFWVCAFGKKVVCQCGCYGRHTFDSIFKVLQWSFAAMHVRDDGVPFSAGERIGDKARKDKEKESPERVVEEWTYINHDSKIGPATIYFNKTVDNHNVIFLSFEPTPWHGKVTLLENEIMVIRFNCRGDTANLHTAMVRKLGKDL